jgi:hypothetical protein
MEVVMTVDAQVQRAANPNHVLEGQFTAQAGLSNNVGRVPVAGQVTRDAAKWKADEKDSPVYDFSTYAEGEEGVRLLIQNGFDGKNLRLVGKGRQGERHPLRFPGYGFLGLVKVFNHESAGKSGPYMLMMHGNAVEAGKAHSVLMEHTNELIEECLRFR